MGTRGLYHRDAAAALAHIELKRRHAKVTVAELAQAAGMTERTLANIRRRKSAFPRQVNALRMALRTIEKQRRQQDRLFAAEGEQRLAEPERGKKP